ncbi:hypothetical protein [Arcicella rigui]|uniref:Uncharacterized protein n=1 Tax=Arcicella rigui TaxID=797020 RepID=A0ABU5Q669_9BACT|nr:hypothetical protein [Arcicella rigui]MEA5138349.1 hypothetical protein [Arcicella rigui]
MNIIEEKYCGILATIDWNSNKWQNVPTIEDLESTKFGYVEENNKTYTAINFGHEMYPSDEDEYYSGLLPQLWTKTPDKEKSKTVKIVILKSKNWKDGLTYIVGFYAFPIFEKGRKKSPIDTFKEYFETNIKSLPKDIYLLENYVLFNEDDEKQFLPKGKKVGKRGYNYLTKDNVCKFLDVMTNKNPDSKLMGIKFRIIKSLN